MSTDRETLRALLRERSILRGAFTLASAATSNVYIDARRTTLSCEGMVLVGKVGLSYIETLGWRPNLVGGPANGANPIATAILMTAVMRGRRDLGGFIVTREPDPYTGSRIAGPAEVGSRIVLVEDVVTSGKSVLEAAAILAEAGLHICGVMTLVDREEGGNAAVVRAGYNFVSIFTARELLAA